MTLSILSPRIFLAIPTKIFVQTHTIYAHRMTNGAHSPRHLNFVRTFFFILSFYSSISFVFILCKLFTSNLFILRAFALSFLAPFAFLVMIINNSSASNHHAFNIFYLGLTLFFMFTYFLNK